MKVSKPNDIVLERLNYNSRTPQQYFDELSKRLSVFDVSFCGFVIEDKWKGNETLTSFEYGGVVYNNYRINKLYRYIKRIEHNGFVKPTGLALTPEILTQKVIDVCSQHDSIEFLGYNTYKGARTYLKLRCNSTNHREPCVWNSTIYDTFIHKGTGCPKCTGTYRYNMEELNENIVQYCDEKGFKNPKLITPETMKGVNSRVKFTCHCGEDADMTYDSLSRSRFCSSCSNGGGYKPQKPGILYILKISTYTDSVVGYKFGITNDMCSRMRHYNQNIYKIEVLKEYHFIDGTIPLQIESKIKKEIPRNYLTKEEIGTGYTETIEPIYYNNIIEIIEKGA